MKFKILNPKISTFFIFVFYQELESNLHKWLLEKGFEGNQSKIIIEAKATGCIELQNACDKKYLTPVISQLN